MSSLSDDEQADIIDAFISTSRYLDHILKLSILISEKWSIKCTSNGLLPTQVQLETSMGGSFILALQLSD